MLDYIIEAMIETPRRMATIITTNFATLCVILEAKKTIPAIIITRNNFCMKLVGLNPICSAIELRVFEEKLVTCSPILPKLKSIIY